MKLSHILLFCGAVALSVTSCRRDTGADELSHDHSHHHSQEEAGHGHEGEEGHDHAHAHGEGDAHEPEGTIVLSPHMAERLGVKVDTAALTDMAPVAKAAGIIEMSAAAGGTAAAPAAGIVTLARGIDLGSEVRAGQLIATVKASAVTGGDPNAAARADLEAARAELDRVKPLWEDRLVTRAQYNQAVAAYERARAAYSAPAASGRVTAPVTGVITSLDARSGQFVDTGAPIASINGDGAMTLRADVPAARYAALSRVTDARIVLPYGGDILVSEAGGRRVGASVAAARAGYVPVTFTFSDSRAIPGTAVDVYLMGDGSRRALTVPETAIVEQQGSFFVYVRLDEDCYLKVPVTTGATDGRRREITSGLHGGEAVVSAATTAITLAAAAGNVPEGHSHSH